MNHKYLFQDLVLLLQQSGQVSKKDAETFVRVFFSRIEEGLFRDGSVKIQDFGSFKLLKVEARDSVNVNTGEKIEIKEHYKISFVPDDALKAEVNMPYAHLQAVDISDQAKPVEENHSTEKEQSELKSTNMSEKEKPVFTVSDTPENNHPSENGQKMKRSKSKAGVIVAWVVFAVVLLGLIAYALFSVLCIPFPKTSERTETVAVQVEEAPELVTEPAKAEVEAPQAAQEPAKAPTPASVKKSVPAKNIQPVSMDHSDPAKWETYAIVSLDKGERLTLLALKYYGHKAFWVYIYEANRKNIKNPNDIKAGTEIRIPRAPSSVINPKSAESISKALELEKKYKAEFAR